MKAYVDSSVLLRIVLAAPQPLSDWPQIVIGLTSALLRVECCRTFDRLVRNGEIADDEYANLLIQKACIKYLYKAEEAVDG